MLMELILPRLPLNIYLSLKYNNFQLAALILFSFAALILVYVLFILVGKKLRRHKRKKIDGLREESYQDALKILDRARTESLKILSRAESRAHNVLNDTYSVSKESKDRLEKNLQQIYQKQEKYISDVNNELIRSYKDIVAEGKKENIRTLYEATEEMKKEAMSGVTEFKNVIQKETLEAQNELESKIQSEYAEIEKEIESYKSEKLKNLNNKIFDILAIVYSEVIGQDLDQIKHEKLIIELLKDEIRRSGLDHGNKSSVSESQNRSTL